MLVNSTRALPKSLVYELLPSIEGHIPPKMRRRREAYILLEHLNRDSNSPFYVRINTTTNSHIESANIKDLSVLRMLENSMKDGILSQFKPQKALELLNNFWSAVSRYYPEAWEAPPKKSRLTHGVGVVSMGYVMDTIAYKLVRNRRVPPLEKFAVELDHLGRSIPWQEGVWEFTENLKMPWNEVQNTSKHMDLVTNYLIRLYHKRAA